MDFEKYLNFLLDIRVEYNRSKNIVIIQYGALGKPVENFLEELDRTINTPSYKLKPDHWFHIGYVLAQYFGKKACKMIYGKTFEEMMELGR